MILICSILGQQQCIQTAAIHHWWSPHHHRSLPGVKVTDTREFGTNNHYSVKVPNVAAFAALPMPHAVLLGSDPFKMQSLLLAIAVSAVMACMAVKSEFFRYVMMTALLHSEFQAAAAYTALFWILQQPGITRLISVPRRPKRLWSDRYEPYCQKEVSNGAWEHVILGKAAKLSEMGLQDKPSQGAALR